MPAQALLAEAVVECYIWFFQISAERNLALPRKRAPF